MVEDDTCIELQIVSEALFCMQLFDDEKGSLSSLSVALDAVAFKLLIDVP